MHERTVTHIAYIAASVCASDCSFPVSQMTVAGCWHAQSDCGEMLLLSPFLQCISLFTLCLPPQWGLMYSPISYFTCDIWIQGFLFPPFYFIKGFQGSLSKQTAPQTPPPPSLSLCCTQSLSCRFCEDSVPRVNICYGRTQTIRSNWRACVET